MTAPTPRMREVLSSALDRCLAQHPEVRLLGEGVGALGGLSGATIGLLERHGPRRVIDTPVSDSATVGLAIGLALGGLRPVVELTGAALTALPQLLGELEPLGAASGEFPVPVVLRVLVGPEGPLAPSPLRLLTGLRGVDLAAPSTGLDLAAVLEAGVRGSRPLLVLEPLERMDQRDPTGWEGLPRGRARRVREGEQITVLAWGAAVHTALEAAAQVQGQARAEVLDLCWLSPLDTPAVLASVQRTGRLLIACGPGEEPFARDLLQDLTDAAFLHLESPPRVVVGGADALGRGIVDSVQY